MSQPTPDDLSMVVARSFFVRKRNTLLVRAHFSPLYMDYYLHLLQNELKHPEKLDSYLKDLLAAVTLHACSRPHDETCAWTVNMRHPLVNFFVTASTRPPRVTGRLFIEDVRDSGKNMFIAQVSRENHGSRQSMVEFHGNDLLESVEHFYTQSEQRITRIFRGEDEEFIMLSAEPDCDEQWLLGLEWEDVVQLDQTEHLTPLETRGYPFECGCSMERLYPLLDRLPSDDIDHIFADGDAKITCPRCANVFTAPRSHFLAWKVAKDDVHSP
jgi:molecular chaperone Hsp33